MRRKVRKGSSAMLTLAPGLSCWPHRGRASSPQEGTSGLLHLLAMGGRPDEAKLLGNPPSIKEHGNPILFLNSAGGD